MASSPSTETKLTSERLVYDLITSDVELENYKSWYTNADVMKYVRGRPLTREEALDEFVTSVKRSKEYPGRGIGYYSVKLKDLTYIGMGKLTYENEELDELEIGYGMLPQFWGKGYGTEIMETLMKHSRGITNVTKLMAMAHPENVPSKKILLAHGFTHYKSIKEDEDGQPSDYYHLHL